MKINDIRASCEAHMQSFLANDSVTAVGIGYLPGTTEIGIIIHVDGSQRLNELALPPLVNGIKVATKVGRFVRHALAETGQAAAPQLPSAKPTPVAAGAVLGNARDAKFEPMIGGVSTNPNYFSSESMGTLGIAIKNSSGQPVILSNQHVICRANPQVGDEVAQPAHEILFHLAASLQAFIEGNWTYNGMQCGMDAAIALPANGRTAQLGVIYGFPGVQFSAAAAPNLGDLVCKSGLTTNITTGSVAQVNTSVKNEDGVILQNQILIANSQGGAAFSESGDSGSVVFNTATHNLVALLWGASGDETVASPIIPILARFNCTVI